ncbi:MULTISPECIES: CDP-alcohol phosphatidyltransferase family protein [unclassified Wenzhouxiangella]|uniref:CDP-alcohol phosphatidyltransferase family protein n=1 Tax=unclassified Wenzhouxiangella TaxID=2613841 RepID=UPI000E32C842|nr:MULTISPECIES: CDP-alcohol phosphatidyltransferase family protein [unclassified Wenzhouxiangella]RFF27499.1 CDP-alcohol phosphatidyltransferase family protein [Wenzhouxiangella sp. 15181]RFP69639.1 CDP-alcohol phosphatidyltransferase family protein [Wenzhouxiangella sp. 15190]
MTSPVIKAELTAGALAAGGLAVLLTPPSGPIWQVTAVAVSVFAVVASILMLALPDKHDLGWANRVTLLRATITCALAGALVQPGLFIEQAGMIVGLTLISLSLDGIDGWLARRKGESSAFGARFDMETDAALILVLCAGLWLSGLAPAWVLAIGLMRPAFLAGALIWPWLSKPLPDSFRRKLVCVVQVSVLPIALLPIVTEPLRLTLLAVALLALCASFTIDIAWLFRNRRPTEHPDWRIS